MTSNQLAYQSNLEQERTNRAKERETERANKAREAQNRYDTDTGNLLSMYKIAASSDNGNLIKMLGSEANLTNASTVNTQQGMDLIGNLKITENVFDKLFNYAEQGSKILKNRTSAAKDVVSIVGQAGAGA